MLLTAFGEFKGFQGTSLYSAKSHQDMIELYLLSLSLMFFLYNSFLNILKLVWRKMSTLYILYNEFVSGRDTHSLCTAFKI